MLTKNFSELTNGILCGVNSKIATTKGTTHTVKGLTGFVDATFSVFQGMIKDASSPSAAGVIFSSSDTPPTRNDFLVSSAVNVSISGPQSLSVYYLDNQINIVSTLSVSNNNSDPVEIKSGYLIGNINGKGVYGFMYFVVDHSLLKTPVTIQPGETKQITYTIRFNYPTPPAALKAGK